MQENERKYIPYNEGFISPSAMDGEGDLPFQLMTADEKIDELQYLL